MSAYYNEIDPYAAQWLRNLITNGRIAAGDVDERSIVDVRPADLAGYSQCHFFAGIGGWSYALRLAGWPDDKPVWTGSCPCQPFSQAGAQRGFDDARHLWPVWFRLIGECRPAVVFGEQVASALAWFDLVQADLEGEGYSVGAADLCAAGVGAPHIRQRLWFVAKSSGAGTGRNAGSVPEAEPAPRWRDGAIGSRGATGGLGDPGLTGLSQRERDGRVQSEAMGAPEGQAAIGGGDLSSVEHATSEQVGVPRRTRQSRGAAGQLGHPNECNGSQEREGVDPLDEQRPQIGGRPVEQPRPGTAGGDGGGLRSAGDGGCGASPWSDVDWLPCRDGKARPVEPGTFPLAHGVSARVGRLRAYGNAIVPQVAAEFIAAYLDCQP